MEMGLVLGLSVRSPSGSSPSGPANIIDPAGWGSPSAGTVSADVSGTVTFAAAGPGANISDTPLTPLKANTTYDVSVTKTAGGGSVQFRYGGAGGTLVLWGGSSAIPAGAPTTQFTTGASDLGDGKVYYRASNTNTSATLSGLSIIEHTP